LDKPPQKADHMEIFFCLFRIAKLKVWQVGTAYANKSFRVFKKTDFPKKSVFSENFMPENLWNLT